ncbi:hypothetical protein [Streptomyces sp. ADI93-02]|uniref:hypothetical protein n=1 Tax=Streptomyces sp. ADI93-02 TaxID=1522757 RepID=UPI000FB9464A|nr:hypothetical protein [Streptomyces sp. ADI93-02]RPK34537.1 hypothetical protein EES40_33280 [Streptomyces sp. ADI93-02]
MGGDRTRQDVGERITDPAPSKKDDTAVRVQPKVLPDIRRSPSGTAQLSDTSQADREVCDSYADYLSFTSPLGSPTDDRFAEGGFTSDLVRFYNDWADSGLGHTFSYRVTGAGLPVFRLSTGSSLVACTLVQEHRTTGAPPTGTVRYDKGSDTDLLLGGGCRPPAQRRTGLQKRGTCGSGPHRPRFADVQVVVAVTTTLSCTRHTIRRALGHTHGVTKRRSEHGHRGASTSDRSPSSRFMTSTWAGL